MPQSFSWEIESETSALEPLRQKLKPLFEGAGFSDKDVQSLLVVLGEASTNCIRHSYGNEKGKRIQITLEDKTDRILLKIRDFGKKIDLKAVPEPVLPPVKGGGLGIYFMKTIMDEVEYNTRHAEGNELILTKYKGKAKS